MDRSNWAPREDGSSKGDGFLGPLRNGKNVSTEISIGVEIGGKETEIPSIVPTLSRSELDHLLRGGKPTDAIVEKAVAFAKKRMAEGLSPFAQPGEKPYSFPEK